MQQKRVGHDNHEHSCALDPICSKERRCCSGSEEVHAHQRALNHLPAPPEQEMYSTQHLTILAIGFTL